MFQNRKLYLIYQFNLMILLYIDQYLRELPHNIAPNALAKFVKDKIDQNLYAKPPEPKIARLTGGGLF